MFCNMSKHKHQHQHHHHHHHHHHHFDCRRSPHNPVFHPWCSLPPPLRLLLHHFSLRITRNALLCPRYVHRHLDVLRLRTILQKHVPSRVPPPHPPAVHARPSAPQHPCLAHSSPPSLPTLRRQTCIPSCCCLSPPPPHSPNLRRSSSR